MAEDPVGIEDFSSVDALPVAARALFGGDAFSTLAWYRSVAAAGLDAGSRACFQVAWRGNAVLGVLPMVRRSGGCAAMTTPYTALWCPLLRHDLDAESLVAVGRAFGRIWRHAPSTRLDALDADAAWFAPLLRGLRGAGLVPLRYDHFGNWHLPVAGLDWDAYLAGRPGELRSAVTRRSRRLMQGAGAAFTLVDGNDGLEAGIAAYERVYAASWKQAEPHPHFVATLMREQARSGTLRLGLLHLDGAPIAAQLWLVYGGWAGVQKLAHDEAHKQSAPGTVLTALAVRHLLDVEGISELDFGRGDDGYKRLWTGERRQRAGIVLATPWLAAGVAQIVRHFAGGVRRLGFFFEKSQKTFIRLSRTR